MSKPRLTVIFLFLFLLCLPPALLRAANNDYVEGEILVRYKPHVSTTAVVRSLSRQGAEGLNGSKRLNIYHVRLPRGTTVEEAVHEFRNDPDVLYAEPNFIVHALSLPNESPSEKWEQQWGLQNTHQAIGPSKIFGTPGADINAPTAWSIQTGSTGVVIAVMDTGMDLDHPDLVHQVWINTGETASNNKDDDGNGYVDDREGWDFVNNDNDPNDDSLAVGNSLNNHGTHVCGIIGAEGNNSIGVVGVNWNVSLMVLKVLGADGKGTVDKILPAFDYAIAEGAQVINASWGSTSFSQALYDAIKDARDHGILLVAAAGNTATVEYPARYNLDNIISVTASDLDDNLAVFNTGIKAAVSVQDVDLAAPGELIYSTFIVGDAPPNLSDNTRDYYWKDGTSQATAFVSGAAGLLLAQDGTLTPDQIKARILESVETQTITDTSILNSTTSGGRLDAGNALDQLNNNQITVVPFDTSLVVGETRQFTLDGATTTNWRTTDSTVGIIDTNGLFTAEGVGSCTVYVYGTLPLLTSGTIYVEEVTVTADTTSLQAGDTVTLTASGGTAPYTWSSSDSNVLSLPDATIGVAKGVDKGSAVITVSDARGYSATSGTIRVAAASNGKAYGNCFIATAAFGSPLEAHVRILQQFRDQYLLPNAPGRAFVRAYYRYSPPLAAIIAAHPALRAIVRVLLIPLVLFGSFMVKTGLSWKAFFSVMLFSIGGFGLLLKKSFSCHKVTAE
jgi:hypothetical protein